MTLEQLAEQTQLSKSALGSYEADDFKDISHYALIKLAKFYGVTADYLLGLTENKKSLNADLADLRLSDEMIELLKSGRIDTALLSELAAHPDFVKLLADIQIYVEGIAATQIQNLNAWVDVARAEIVEKYQPGEHDRPAGVLQAPMYGRATISAAGYITILTLSWRTYGKPQGRSDTPRIIPLWTNSSGIWRSSQLRGSRAEQLLMVFCKQTKLRYTKLTEEEKQWLTRIVQKSELAKSYVPQRGKRK